MIQDLISPRPMTRGKLNIKRSKGDRRNLQYIARGPLLLITGGSIVDRLRVYDDVRYIYIYNAQRVTIIYEFPNPLSSTFRLNKNFRHII